MNEIEIWKDIEGYEGLYQVSNLGRVKSMNYWNRNKEQCLKLQSTKDGYYQVGLHKNHKKYHCRIHQLVAKAFLNNPLGYVEVNHKNEVKTDNRAVNLEWCSRKYNCNYGSHIKKLIEKSRKTRVGFDYKVYCYSIDCTKLITIFETGVDAQNNGYGGHSSITAACRGKLNSHCSHGGTHVYKGFYWSYTPIKLNE